MFDLRWTWTLLINYFWDKTDVHSVFLFFHVKQLFVCRNFHFPFGVLILLEALSLSKRPVTHAGRQTFGSSKAKHLNWWINVCSDAITIPPVGLTIRTLLVQNFTLELMNLQPKAAQKSPAPPAALYGGPYWELQGLPWFFKASLCNTHVLPYFWLVSYGR